MRPGSRARLGGLGDASEGRTGGREASQGSVLRGLDIQEGA